MLPSAKLTLVQVLIGVVDLGFCAAAMYLLVPAQPHIDFLSLSVVLILATLIGFASHAPGSLGVFDAAMLVALPQFGREQLLATLLVFRMLYFVTPFAIAISIMGTRELWLNVVDPWQSRRRTNGDGNGICVPMMATQPSGKPTPVPAPAKVAPPLKRMKSQG